MVYIPNTEEDRSDMLKAIGVDTFEDLISNIPPSLRVKGALGLPPALSEYEVIKHMNELSQKNLTTSTYSNFLGGGAYDHISPVIVDAVISRPEFYTAYTPYQAELSQGTLQAMYEFQSSVSLLAGLEIANASLYDGATAVAEAILMASNVNRKNKMLIAETLNPNYIKVVKTYTQGLSLELNYIKENGGIVDINDLKEKLDEDVSAVVIQHPNFFGNLESVDEISKLIESFPKTLFIVSFNPVSVGMLNSPGNYGADIAIAEGQALGIPLSFGGPYIGLLATKQEYVRKMPGRMAGKTIDINGKEGFVLALQTREQHIKRERATSNICTNQGLMAIAVLTYLCYMGKEGLYEVARQSYSKSHYLADKISELNGFKLKYDKEFFNEFVVESDFDITKVIDKLKENKILGGVNLADYDSSGLMIAVTEKRSKEELDRFVEVLKQI